MKVFISYCTKDQQFVERLAKDLRTSASIDAWLDKWDILPGERIPKKIEEGISNASVFVLVLSPESIDSTWVNLEKDTWLTMQTEEEKCAKQQSCTPRRLIPVRYKNCQLPPFLQSIKYVSINEETYENGFQQLVRGIRGQSDKPPLNELQPIVTHLDTLSFSSQDMALDQPQDMALYLLKKLNPSQFEQVLFYYRVDKSEMPNKVSQTEYAIEVIKLGIQKEGNSLSELLDTVYRVVPHLRN